MRVRDALMKLRLPGREVDGRLAVENQPVNASLDKHDAGDVLLGIDDLVGLLLEANHADVDRTGRQTVEFRRVECLDGDAAGERLRARIARSNWVCARARSKSQRDRNHQGQSRRHDALNFSSACLVTTDPL